MSISVVYFLINSFRIIMSIFVELPYLNIRRFLISHWLNQFESDEKELNEPLLENS